MKRHQSIALLSVFAATLAISGYSQEFQEKKTLEERVEQLEKDLELANSNLESLTASATAEAAKIDAVTKYIQEQAVAADAMVSTIATMEVQGFTKGINFGSRETMLAGWRAQLSSTQKGLPGGKAVAVEEPNTRGRNPRRR
ncbi:MAG: cell division septum initiation protein DivIVA [Planctomycetota bacterium]|jgi:cell division septum initiation protein DivIVA